MTRRVRDSDTRARLLAEELIRHGFRTPTVSRTTGLSEEAVRHISKNTPGAGSQVGPYRSPVSYAETWTQHASVSIFADIYYTMYHDSIFDNIAPEELMLRVCRAHENYILTHVHTNQPVTPMDVNTALEVVRGMLKREIILMRCSVPECSYPSVVIADQHKPLACSLCHAPLC